MNRIVLLVAFVTLACCVSWRLPKTFANSQNHVQAQSIEWEDQVTRARESLGAENASAAEASIDRLAPMLNAMRTKALVGPEAAIPDDDIKLGQFMIAPGTVYTSHRHPLPEIYHVVQGEANIYVADETIEASPGTTVRVPPGEVHGLTVKSDTPLKIVWVQWRPAGYTGSMTEGYELLEFPDPNMIPEPMESEDFFPITLP